MSDTKYFFEVALPVNGLFPGEIQFSRLCFDSFPSFDLVKEKLTEFHNKHKDSEEYQNMPMFADALEALELVESDYPKTWDDSQPHVGGFVKGWQPSDTEGNPIELAEGSFATWAIQRREIHHVE